MTPGVIQRWRLLFLILESYVGIISISFAMFGHGRHIVTLFDSRVADLILGIAWLVAWLFLLVVSPFFLGRLRRVALVGWILAFGILILTVLTPNI